MTLLPVKGWRKRCPLALPGPSATSDSLAERILDGVFDEHGGAAEGGRALRSALRRQDLTRRFVISGAPIDEAGSGTEGRRARLPLALYAVTRPMTRHHFRHSKCYVVPTSEFEI